MLVSVKISFSFFQTLAPPRVFTGRVNQRRVDETNWLVSNQTGWTVAENWPLVSKYCRSMQLESCWVENRCGPLCEVAAESRKVSTESVVVTLCSIEVSFFWSRDFWLLNAFLEISYLHSEVPATPLFSFLLDSVDVGTPAFSFGREWSCVFLGSCFHGRPLELFIWTSSSLRHLICTNALWIKEKPQEHGLNSLTLCATKHGAAHGKSYIYCLKWIMWNNSILTNYGFCFSIAGWWSLELLVHLA